jgi:asparagine synthase (glutamine-hydrolysing)
MVSTAAGVVCVADAKLYYRSRLMQRLGLAGLTAGVAVPDLVARAYDTFGIDVSAHLEGDFAFALWDPAKRVLIASRDAIGCRALFCYASRDVIMLASTIKGIVDHPMAPKNVDMDTVVESAACLSRHSSRTCYVGVLEVPAGSTLTWTPGTEPEIRAWWKMPTPFSGGRSVLADSTAELRSLLTDAVAERLRDRKVAAVNLSGGYDSTAVYGFARNVVEDRGSGEVRAISMSYPRGDPGREDETIQQVVDYRAPGWTHTASVAWESSEDVSLFGEDPMAGAGERDDAVGHHFDSWNRRLSQRACAEGCTLTLTGAGGDQLFHMTSAYLADLVRGGQLVTAYSQWRKRGGSGWRSLRRSLLQPLLPEWVVGVLPHVGGPVLRSAMDRRPPLYFNADYVRRTGLDQRDQTTRPGLPAGGLVRGEEFAALRFSHVTRTMARLSQTAVECGVEVRHPLLDSRVVEFALSRPWYEKVDGHENKILLRRAAQGFVPEAVLAPRASRTGQSGGWFIGEMRRSGHRLATSVGFCEVLGDLGVVNPRLVNQGWEYLLKNDDADLAFELYHTLQAELWLRSAA